MVLLLLVRTMSAADQPAALPCAEGVPDAPACLITPQTRQDAHKAFQEGMKLQKQKRLEEALAEFERASNLVPQDLQYATLRELTRQQVVYEHLQRGNSALAENRPIEALGEFRNVLHFDPNNDFAQRQVQDAWKKFRSSSAGGIGRNPYCSERHAGELPFPRRFAATDYAGCGRLRDVGEHR
jgi:tetratricopeptide (TPR) repeat protein